MFAFVPDMLPFTREQFFAVFAGYNEAVWPAQIALLAVALGAVVAVVRFPARGALAGAALAVLWGWMAVVYHAISFTRISPVGWAFAAIFLAGSALFARATLNGSLVFDSPRGLDGAVGVAFVAYALLGYTMVGELAGHHYPAAPTFGVPCPTTIFTLGLLLLARRPRPRVVFVIPLLWSAIGSTAAFRLGVREDFGLLAAGVATMALLLRRAPSSQPSPHRARTP